MSVPTITTQPVSVVARLGTTVVFSVGATTDNGPLTYQWFFESDSFGGGPIGFTDPSEGNGAQGPVLTLFAIVAEELGLWSCEATNASGSVMSTVATLTRADGDDTGGEAVGDWTVNGTSASLLGISNIRRSRRSLDIDTLTFDAPGRAIDADPLFSYGATVEVAGPFGRFFEGVVTQTPATGTAEGESHAYTISGPWWHLSHLVARQQWNTPTGETTTTLSGKLILGQALDGTRLTTGGTMTSLLSYAIESGAPLRIGLVDQATQISTTILAGYLAPLDEVKDVTVGDAVRQVMRWHPNAVSWFDYSVSPPLLFIRPGGAAGTAAYAVGVPPLSGVSAITPRHDLRVPVVVIHYEVTGSADGTSTFNIVTDAAPPGATGRELNALCVTIPLRGTTGTSVEARVETRGIRDDLDADGSDEIRDYLLAFHPDLRKAADDPTINADGITITACRRILSDANAKKYDAESGGMIDDEYNSTLDRHLISGGITDWMIRNNAIRAQVQRIVFDYKTDGGSGTDPSAVKTYADQSIDLTATNAGTAGDAPTSTSYRTLTSYDPGDEVPTGLAAACLAAFGVLHFSGSVTLIEAEASGGVGIGCVLNITNGAGAWVNMQAMITSEEIDVATGTTTLTFGPPEHLAPAEFVQLLKVARTSVGGRTASPAGLATPMSGIRAGNV